MHHGQVRIQPNEAIYLKMVAKQPGLGMKTLVSELDLTYKDRYPQCYIPEAYERLILDAIRGDQQHFVRRCEPGMSSWWLDLLNQADLQCILHVENWGHG